ncbi:arsenate reductase [Myxococcaceae bacterium]|nr:arsenate reductase [Myxococcaceae bacterium]
MKCYEVLFLCTGNSARSILAEAILGRIGGDRFRAHSAGSHPKGAVHPAALALLEELGHPTAELRSKSWDEFAAPGSASLDFIFTVCDAAAGESCPVWPGQPMTAHWGLPDPAGIPGPGTARRAAFRETYFALERRIRLFLDLPLATLDRLTLEREVDAIGRA